MIRIAFVMIGEGKSGLCGGLPVGRKLRDKPMGSASLCSGCLHIRDRAFQAATCPMQVLGQSGRGLFRARENPVPRSYPMEWRPKGLQALQADL
jgi:hypothetical protein